MISELVEALEIVLVQFGPYHDGDGAAKYHAVNIARAAIAKATNGGTIMKRGTVGALRVQLAGLDDDTPLLLPISDHGYRHGEAQVTTALAGADGWNEDHGELTPEAEYGKRTTVVVVD